MVIKWAIIRMKIMGNINGYHGSMDIDDDKVSSSFPNDRHCKEMENFHISYDHAADALSSI